MGIVHDVHHYIVASGAERRMDNFGFDADVAPEWKEGMACFLDFAALDAGVGISGVDWWGYETNFLSFPYDWPKTGETPIEKWLLEVKRPAIELARLGRMAAEWYGVDLDFWKR